MRGYDLMVSLRHRANDVGKLNYTDDEILHSLNSAIRWLSLALIARRAPEMRSSKEIVDWQACPEGFHSFCGQFPVWREGDVLRSALGAQAVMIHFFQTREPLKSLSDEITFPEDYADALIGAALVLLLDSDEFDTSPEKATLAQIEALLPGKGKS